MIIILSSCSIWTNGGEPNSSEKTTVEPNSSEPTETTGNADNRKIILSSDYTNEKRNELLIADINFFRKQLTDKHKNLFHNVTKEEFDANVDTLISAVGELTNKQIFVEMNKIIASIGDAHTGMNYWDGFTYPLEFYCFNDGIYVIEADISLEDVLYAKVIKINGIDIDIITEELKALISYENEYWAKERIPDYLMHPVYMYGLGIIPDEEKTEFEFEALNGEIIKKEINILGYGEEMHPINANIQERNVHIFEQFREDYYWYEYLNDDKVLYFKYNVCENMKKTFKDFNNKMFESIKDYDIEKFVIDLRHNYGGNSAIINPFLESIQKLASDNPLMKIYVITGRQTFSSGVMAVMDIKEKVPVIIVGESTGGSPNSYGEVENFKLPNSKIPVYYSVKYFQLTKDGATTISPDINIEPEIHDYINNNDVVMKYIKGDK